MSGAEEIAGGLALLPLYTALITGSLAILGLVFQRFSAQKDAERREQRAVYSAYISSSVDTVATEMYADPKARELAKSRLMEARWALLLHSSDDVARIVSKNADDISRYLVWFDAFRNNEVWPEGSETSSKKMEESFSQLIVAMRSDCFPKSKLGADELEKLLPFYTNKKNGG